MVRPPSASKRLPNLTPGPLTTFLGVSSSCPQPRSREKTWLCPQARTTGRPCTRLDCIPMQKSWGSKRLLRETQPGRRDRLGCRDAHHDLANLHSRIPGSTHSPVYLTGAPQLGQNPAASAIGLSQLPQCSDGGHAGAAGAAGSCPRTLGPPLPLVAMTNATMITATIATPAAT